jgi:hypothetical protein
LAIGGGGAPAPPDFAGAAAETAAPITAAPTAAALTPAAHTLSLFIA